jgi:hypothetical protein
MPEEFRMRCRMMCFDIKDFKEQVDQPADVDKDETDSDLFSDKSQPPFQEVLEK